MSAEPARSMRCPSCGRLLGNNRVPSGHTDCPAAHETKCGKCGRVVLVPMDPNQQPTSI